MIKLNKRWLVRIILIGIAAVVVFSAGHYLAGTGIFGNRLTKLDNFILLFRG